MTPIIDKLVKAKASLVMDDAATFFANALYQLPFKASSDVESIGVDGVHIFYNPDSEYLASLTMAQLKGLLCHEVMHPLNGHHLRRGSREFIEWNEACDFAINPIIMAAGLELPEDCYDDAQFHGMSAEGIYFTRKAQQDDASDDGDDTDDGPGDGAQDSPGADDTDDVDDDDAPDDGAPGDAHGAAEGGSQGEPAPNVGGCGCVMDYPGDPDDNTTAPPSPADLAEEQQRWNIIMAQAAQTARVAGDLPGDVERMVDELLSPQAPWDELMREFMTQKANDDYAWTPPNRRYVWRDMYLPSATSTRMGEIVVALDTSCSVNADILALGAAETNGILDEIRPDVVHVVSCDVRITDAIEVTPDEYPVEFELHGGGGTRFAPVFEWVEEQGIEPACLVYFTDMESRDLPDLDDPGYPVLWIDWKGSIDESLIPFGEHIVINQ